EAAIDANGNITMGDDIGGTGESTIDDAIRHATETAGQGWNFSANGDEDTTNVAPGDTVDFGNEDENIVVTATEDGLSFDLAENITLGEGDNAIDLNGETGNITTGDSILGGEGLTVGDETNSTTVAAGGTTVTDGTTTTVTGPNGITIT